MFHGIFLGIQIFADNQIPSVSYLLIIHTVNIFNAFNNHR